MNPTSFILALFCVPLISFSQQSAKSVENLKDERKNIIQAIDSLEARMTEIEKLLSQPQPKPEPKPKPQAQVKTEPKVNTKAEPKEQVTAEVKTEPKQESEPIAKTEPKPQPEPETKIEPEPKEPVKASPKPFTVDKTAAMIIKYGKSKGKLIAQGKVWVNISYDAAADSWGKPIDVERRQLDNGIAEKWIYPDNRFLFFKNGRLASWKN